MLLLRRLCPHDDCVFAVAKATSLLSACTVSTAAAFVFSFEWRAAVIHMLELGGCGVHVGNRMGAAAASATSLPSACSDTVDAALA